MKKFFIAITTTLLITVSMYAVPAKPIKKTLKLTDGSTIELTLRGDEYYSFYTDDAGNPYQLNVDQRVERITMDEVRERWNTQKQAHMEETEAAIGMKPGQRAPRRVGTAGQTTGNHRGLVILMQFQDVQFKTDNPQATFNRFFNEVGYSDDGNTGSVRDYFLAQSYNKLTIDFDVVGPYTTKYDMAYYGAPSGDSHDCNPQGMVYEGVVAAHEAGVDFSNYDWDNDGEVDQIFVIYAGYAEAQGAEENTIWPHESRLYGDLVRTYDGKTIKTYGCSSELQGDGRRVVLDGIGTACHEFSHCLGLPDMYDINYSGGFGTSIFDVMCSGSYNNDSRTPAGYTSYERWFAGWMEPVEINSLTRVNDMKPLATNPEAYILYNDKNKNEYYLLENRQPVGFDEGLYGSHGLLILHVDYNEGAWSSNSVNTIASHQRMTIIPADNQLRDYYATDLQGDPWPGITGNTMLTNYTTPAATLYNENTDGSKFMNKAIDNITEDVNAMTVSFVACRPPMEVPSPDDGIAVEGSNAFTVTWPAVAGAQGYELELTEMKSASDDPAEALQFECDFDKFVSASVGFSDISSKLSQYGLSGWSGSKLYTSPKKMKMGTSTTNGSLQSSWKLAPESQQITFVVGAEPFTSGSMVKVNMAFESSINGKISSSIVTENTSFDVSADGKHVVSFNIPKQNDVCRLNVSPEAQMYMNYLAIYEGIWTAEQLGISSHAAPRRANTVIKTFTSTTNSFTFTELNTKNRFLYRVRALGEENTYSAWSDEKEFLFGPTAIMGITSDVNAPIRYFDLQGREVDASHRGLVIMRQGNTVKKVIR